VALTHRTFVSSTMGAMKKLSPLALVMMSLSTLAACGDAAPTSGPPPLPSTAGEVPAALARAHAAYLADDLVGMERSLHDVLADEAADPDVRDNALSLLEAAYERKGGTLPTDWALPSALDRLEVGQVRVEEPGVLRYSSWLGGRIDDPARLQELVLSRGGEVLLDREAGRGRLKVERDGDGLYSFSLEGDEEAHPFGPGVYDLRVDLAGAPPVTGWVLVGDLVSKAAPIIREPDVEAVVDGNPTLAFDDFTSPDYRPFERRSLWIGVWRQHATVWSMWTGKPGFTSVVLGKDARGGPEGPLMSGRNWVSMQFAERRRFGPVLITRASRSQRPFDVR
jgi:hypothetical protein